MASGKVDIECGSSTVTLSRLEKVDFTSLTFVDGGSLLVKKGSAIRGIASLVDETVAVIPNTTTDRALRDMLSRNLQAVVAQMLLPRAGGAGRVPAHEILIGAPRVRQLVAAGVTDFGLAMEAGRGVGMQTFDDALLSLYERGAISQQIAVSRMSDRGRMPAPAPDESVAAA